MRSRSHVVQWEILLSYVIVPRHLKVYVSGHTSILLVFHEMWKIWKQIEFADVLGAIAQDLQLTRCAQVCFAGTEEDQVEQHDEGTIDEVLGNQYLEQRKDVLEEADREADLLEQIPLPGHPESEKERFASWLRLPRRARVSIRRLHRHL